jgi:hypothetical protein
MKIMITEPIYYNSQLDEDHFFHWLQKIKNVTGVKGGKHGLEVTIDGELDAENLFDLIALMTRYELDMKWLRPYCLTVDKKYFADPQAYWFDAVFKDSKKRGSR